MASSGSDDYYSSTKEEITAINNQLQSVVTLTPSSSDDPPPSLPTLTVDLVVEILCRLPVKLLLQLRCICKLWNHVISHPKFSKKHLSTTRRRLHLVSHTEISGKLVLTSYPLDSVLTGITTNITKFAECDEKYPRDEFDYIVGSCDGIFCLGHDQKRALLLWNPSIRKFKWLPLKMPRKVTSFSIEMNYGFGYDHVSDNYKVVVAISYDDDYNSTGVLKTLLKVYTLGTNVWKTVQEEFPIGVELLTGILVNNPGKFVSGKINWLACKEWNEESSKCSIVSFDLGNESYQQVLLPDFGKIRDPHIFVLGVLRDCLCLIVRHDVWVMKEFGNKESWTKLFTVSYLRDPNKHFHLTKAVYIFEDDQVLLQSFGDWNSRLIVYDSRNSSFKLTKIASSPEVCVESLISPCF